MDIRNINSGVLAYIGDSIYEVNIRKYLISTNINKVNDLQKEAIKYVSAKAQAEILEKLIEENFFKEEELKIIFRARNYKPNSKPKHTCIVTYKKATAFEALFGSLYISGKEKRIEEIIKKITGV